MMEVAFVRWHSWALADARSIVKVAAARYQLS